MINKIENFKRKEIFEHYHKCDNPFIISTIKVDVTNIVNYCKKHKNFYPTFGFLITKTANMMDCFKYRYKNENFYFCEELISNYTQMFDEDSIGYFNVPFIDDIDKYRNNFFNVQNKFIEDKNYSIDNVLNEIWISCIPWISFSSLITPFSKENLIPQFIWDKIVTIDNKHYVNLMIMIHHGFADGFHVGKFINLLEENIKNFN